MKTTLKLYLHSKKDDGKLLEKLLNLCLLNVPKNDAISTKSCSNVVCLQSSYDMHETFMRCGFINKEFAKGIQIDCCFFRVFRKIVLLFNQIYVEKMKTVSQEEVYDNVFRFMKKKLKKNSELENLRSFDYIYVKKKKDIIIFEKLKKIFLLKPQKNGRFESIILINKKKNLYVHVKLYFESCCVWIKKSPNMIEIHQNQYQIPRREFSFKFYRFFGKIFLKQISDAHVVPPIVLKNQIVSFIMKKIKTLKITEFLSINHKEVNKKEVRYCLSLFERELYRSVCELFHISEKDTESMIFFGKTMMFVQLINDPFEEEVEEYFDEEEEVDDGDPYDGNALDGDSDDEEEETGETTDYTIPDTPIGFDEGFSDWPDEQTPVTPEKTKKKNECEDGVNCKKFWSEAHMKEFSHPFNKVCDNPYFCNNPYFEHRNERSHICTKGLECKQKEDKKHKRNYIHVDYKKFQEKKYKETVRMWKCRHHCKIDESNTKFRKIPNFEIDLENNGQNNYDQVKCSLGIKKEIIDWVKLMKPVHRCDIVRLKYMINTGMIISRNEMIKMFKNPEGFCENIIDGLLRTKFEKEGIKFDEKNTGSTTKKYIMCELELEHKGTKMTPKQKKDCEKKFKILGNILKSINIPTEKLKRILEYIKVETKEFFDYVKKIKPKGCNYDKDSLLETDKCVFSIIGPHTGYYYGNVCLIFNKILMYHPDFSVTTAAGTSFLKGFSSKNIFPMKWKNTMKNTDGNDVKENIKVFHKSKMNPAVTKEKYYLSCATDLVQKFFSNCQKDITIEMFQEKYGFCFNGGKKLYKKKGHVDCHNVLEGHLPTQIPFSYVDFVLMREKDFSKLTIHEAERLYSLIGNKKRLIIIKNNCEKRLNRRIQKFSVYEPKIVNDYNGLCFGITKEDSFRFRNEGFLLPIFIRTPNCNYDNRIDLDFYARGTDFVITLLDEEKIEKVSIGVFSGVLPCLVSTILKKSSISYMFRTSGEKDYKKKTCSINFDFNKLLCEKLFIGYRIVINSQDKYICLMHKEPYSLINNCCLELPDVDIAEMKLKYVSVTIFKNDVVFRNMRIRRLN